MTKYYINGKEITKEEANNVKAKNAELQKKKKQRLKRLAGHSVGSRN